MRAYTKITALVIFVALMFIKVSSFHVYSHLDEETDLIENCSSCELAIENQQSPQLDTADCSYTITIGQIAVELVVLQPETIISQSQSRLLFSRPPPTIS